MGEDPQKVKRNAASAYDYEKDSRWADYWSNVLIPPHMASRSDVVDHFKRKFYQRYIVPPKGVDSGVDVLPALGWPAVSLADDDDDEV
ncbi:hypothetical protein CTI12_AA600800 [Artemisia annua]|uniref:Uncharacterized protein n=1 Tax=Artemisia annua TaxID=35608 RepID=A0A2U1KHQ1_ARTAN|nr:hypothetical protein CTI12_AA600800 [Artemisia annua]